MYNFTNDSQATARLHEAAEFLLTSKPMKIVLTLKLLTCIAGIFGTSALIYNRRLIVAHRNLRVLLLIHYWWSLMNCIAVMIDGLMFISKQMTYTSIDDLITSGTECSLRRGFNTTCIYGLVFSLVVISLERAAATIWYKTYNRCPHWSTKPLIALQLTVPILIITPVLFKYDFTRRYAYCTIVVPSNLEISSVVVIMFIMMELSALLCYHLLICTNRKMRSRRYEQGLEPRYQVNENLRTLLMLTPLVWSHMANTLFAAILWMVWPLVNPNMPEKEYPIIEELCNFLHVHAIVLPILLYARYRLECRRNRELLKENYVGQQIDSAFVNKYWFIIQEGW